jgi:uncharacterized protein (DUF1330 family)
MRIAQMDQFDHARSMITCYLRYVIDPYKVEQFEEYAKKWLPLVERFGGSHHGYFLPYEGANNVAIALFSLPSLAAYETYRSQSQTDPDCCAAYDFEKKNHSIISYERTFMRSLLKG